MRRAPFTLLVTAAAVCALAAGQSEAQVRPGARVRVQVDSPPPPRTIVGVVSTLTRDALWLTPPNGGAGQRIPTSAIGRLEVSTGRGVVASHVIMGTLGGALLGGVIGGVTSPCSKDQWLCLQGLAIAGGMLLGGAAGAVTGVLIKGEHWRTVTLPSVALVSAPGRGVGVALHLEF